MQGLVMAVVLAAGSAASAETDHMGYVEANRPRIAVRQLDGKERSAMRTALSAARQPTPDRLLVLKPFADSGDAAAMRAMMDGYAALEKTASSNYFFTDTTNPTPRYTALAGLWAMALWRQHPPAKLDKEQMSALMACVITPRPNIPWDEVVTFTGRHNAYDCGFDTVTSKALHNNLHLKGARLDKAFRFVERPVSQSEVDGLRFAQALRLLNDQPLLWSNNGYGEADIGWAWDYARRNPAVAAQWEPAQFAYELRQVRYKEAGLSKRMQAYVSADPARARRFEDAKMSRSSDRSAARAHFQNTIATASINDRARLAEIAIREGGDPAKQWWAKFGMSDAIGLPTPERWCNVGVSAACKVATDRAVAARVASTQSAGGVPGAGVDHAKDLEAFKKREAGLNRANCARASMGANIKCN